MAFDLNQIAQANCDLAVKDLLGKLAVYVNALVDPVSEDFETRIAALEDTVTAETTGLVDLVAALTTALGGATFTLTTPQDDDTLVYASGTFVNVGA